MEANKILTADILEIIFEGRNKGYGAFDLRKNYNKRLLSALGLTIAITALLCIVYIAGSSSDTIIDPIIQIDDGRLIEIPPENHDILPPPPKQKPAPVRLAMTSFATIKIVPNDKMIEDEKPPAMEDLSRSKIGLFNQSGTGNDDIVAPPANTEEKGIVELLKKEKDSNDSIFRKVEIESYYPDGAGAWLRYLNKTFRYPQEAVDNEIQGTVIVQFIIDREGKTSEVQAIGGPVSGGLRQEAERVIQKSGRWEPAIQNGRKVKSYRLQPITFRLSN